ncbi:Aste57867_17759 [Aphanomyces stellatus]|uniref:Aste57867_17759 protein n=1 Tax=Aphanomyces stellatus TaxID=120398 RepID=A0A485LC20_9STRA|nr:hypothetical protein As57867_017698 [Aphanomyces stellatus]VFT94505.1 Aste57867_17759 [Aphanomyces stellatus]
MHKQERIPMAVPVARGYGSVPLHEDVVVPQEDCFWVFVTSPFRWLTWKMLLFHVANVVLASVAFAVITTGLALGTGLLPLCCLGVVVFKVLLYIVYHLAQCDAVLYNMIAPPNEHIAVGFECPPTGFAYEGIRVAPALASFSRDAVLATIYYLLVKFPLSVLFSSSLVVAFATSFAFLSFPWTFPSHWHMEGSDVRVLGRHITDDDAPFMLVLGVLGLYLAIFLMQISGRILQSITKFCTCEYFCIYGFAHAVPVFNAGQPIQGQQTLYVQI